MYDHIGMKIDPHVLNFMKDYVMADGSAMAEAPQEAVKILKQFFRKNQME